VDRPEEERARPHKLVCRGTVEERIDELIAGKRELAGEVLAGGVETALTELSDEDLTSLVSLDLSRAREG
jgi:non-specific serine/threonine protein kinase